jgi:hypothetical protein
LIEQKLKRNRDFEDKIDVFDLNHQSEAILYNTIKGVEMKTKPGGALLCKE